jgi:hypothetical protein
MQHINVSDKPRTGGRAPEILVVFRQGKYNEFDGENKPGFFAIISENYEKNGKWSGTDFVVGIPDDAVPVIIGSHLHENIGQGMTWKNMYERFVPKGTDVTLELFRIMMQEKFKRISARIEETEAAIAALDMPLS